MPEIIRKDNFMKIDIELAIEQSRVHAVNNMIDIDINPDQAVAISHAIASMITDTLSAINENQDNVQF